MINKHLLSRHEMMCPFCNKTITLEKYHLYNDDQPSDYVHKEWFNYCEHMQDPTDDYRAVRFVSSVDVPLVEVS